VGPILDTKGASVSASEDMCNEFNDFFASVFTEEKPGAVPEAKRIFKGRMEEELCDISRGRTPTLESNY